jgi:single-stranded-DNA-specific exonuclease
MHLKKINEVETILDFNEVASALFKENNIVIESEEDFERLFPDQMEADEVDVATCIAGMSQLKKADEFVEFINTAKKDTNKICVLSDYDADGICSALIMLAALRRIGVETSLYIPDRLEGGYGAFNKDIIEKKIKDGFTYFVTLDCGISMKDTAELIHNLGGHLAVTDHHLPGDSIPENCLIVDPKYNGDESADICGALVAFKLVMALCNSNDSYYNRISAGDLLNDLAFLAGIATVTDMMVMLGENRLFVKHVFAEVNSAKEIALAGGYKTFVYYFVSSLGGYNFLQDADKLATEELISFYIGPTLNAISRVGEDVVALVEDIFSALMNKSTHYIHSKVSTNYVRRARTKELVDACYDEAIGKDLIANDDLTLINFNPDSFNFPITGLLGIVANKLTNSDHKVTFVGTAVDEDTLSFSARSEATFNLHEAMERIGTAHPEFGIEGGGHANAMGIRFKKEYIQDFFDALSEDITHNKITVDPSIYSFEPDELDDVVNTLMAFAPYGQGFQSLKVLYKGKFHGRTTLPFMYNIGDIAARGYLTEDEENRYLNEDESSFVLTVNPSSKLGAFFNIVKSVEEL